MLIVKLFYRVVMIFTPWDDIMSGGAGVSGALWEYGCFLASFSFPNEPKN